MKRLLILLFITITAMGFAQNPINAVIICNSKVILHESPTLSSPTVAYLLPGEIVRIIDTTSERFQIGTAELICKDFPFVKVLKQDSIVGWASGQFIFKLLSKSNKTYRSLIKSKNTFHLENHIFEIYLGRNYGIPTSYKGEITGCEEFYPVILLDQMDGKYILVEMKNNPNSNYPYWNLKDDEGTGENIVGITSSGNNVTFSIKCIYQEGSCTYNIEIQKNGNIISGKTNNYKRKEE